MIGRCSEHVLNKARAGADRSCRLCRYRAGQAAPESARSTAKPPDLARQGRRYSEITPESWLRLVAWNAVLGRILHTGVLQKCAIIEDVAYESLTLHQ